MLIYYNCMTWSESCCVILTDVVKWYKKILVVIFESKKLIITCVAFFFNDVKDIVNLLNGIWFHKVKFNFLPRRKKTLSNKSIVD